MFSRVVLRCADAAFAAPTPILKEKDKEMRV